MMFSKRRNALASGAIVASIALSGARAQSAEDESRLLIAVTAPKVVDVGGDSAGEGFATISFKTGPNLVSYDYTVSCYERNLDVPTTSCNAIADDEYPAAGNSVSGETGKAYDKIIANVTGLDGDDTYDCFIYTSGPQGYEKCKYVGSTDVDCFAAEPLAFVEDASGPNISLDGTILYELDLTAEIAALGNPAIPSAQENAVAFVCLEGSPDDVTCPADVPLDSPFPIYPDPGTTELVVSDLTPNTEYTCFSLIEDTCDAEADPICSDGLGLVTAPSLAFRDPVDPEMFSFGGAGLVTMTCGRSTDPDTLPVVNFWTCSDADPAGTLGVPGDWFEVDCAVGTGVYTTQTKAITNFDTNPVYCWLWQGQGEGCSPFSTELCNWYAQGTQPDYDDYWYSEVTPI